MSVLAKPPLRPFRLFEDDVLNEARAFFTLKNCGFGSAAGITSETRSANKTEAVTSAMQGVPAPREHLFDLVHDVPRWWQFSLRFWR